MADRTFRAIIASALDPMSLSGDLNSWRCERRCKRPYWGTALHVFAVALLGLGCTGHLEVVRPGGPSVAVAAAAPTNEGDRRAAIPMGTRASLVHVDDDAALDSDHGEDDVRYNPKKPLTISDRMSQRCRQHLPALDRAAEKHGVDTLLLAAIAWVESGFSPGIGSYAGSLGIMQLQPGTSRSLGCRDPHDVTCAADAASIYIRALLRRYRGDLVYALCAYHAGPVRPSQAWRRGELPTNLHYATRVLEARSRLERYGCEGRPAKGLDAPR